MLAHLNTGAAAALLYGQALDTLALIQLHGASGARELPPYDAAALRREMQLLPDWFCARHLALALDEGERALLADTFEFLEREALRQPVVLVHRDYHSRNLMVCADSNPGILDFQDAVRGAVAYDLVSLLRDLYIVWPASRVREWLLVYRRKAQAAGVEVGSNEMEFMRWFELAGLQRHLKVLGIFARLWHRDGKAAYLEDLPATLAYVLDASSRYRELAPLHRFLSERALPNLAEANQRAHQAPPRGRA